MSYCSIYTPIPQTCNKWLDRYGRHCLLPASNQRERAIAEKLRREVLYQCSIGQNVYELLRQIAVSVHCTRHHAKDEVQVESTARFWLSELRQNIPPQTNPRGTSPSNAVPYSTTSGPSTGRPDPARFWTAPSSPLSPTPPTPPRLGLSPPTTPTLPSVRLISPLRPPPPPAARAPASLANTLASIFQNATLEDLQVAQNVLASRKDALQAAQRQQQTSQASNGQAILSPLINLTSAASVTETPSDNSVAFSPNTAEPSRTPSEDESLVADPRIVQRTYRSTIFPPAHEPATSYLSETTNNVAQWRETLSDVLNAGANDGSSRSQYLSTTGASSNLSGPESQATAYSPSERMTLSLGNRQVPVANTLLDEEILTTANETAEALPSSDASDESASAESTSQEECIICLGSLESGYQIIDGCEQCHSCSWHDGCILRWLTSSPSCPLCRGRWFLG